MILQGICHSFIEELFSGTHDLTADTLKMALYTSSADLSPSATTVYTTAGEATGTGYTAGGVTVTTVAVTLYSETARGVVYVDFDNPEWASSTITARGAMLYNSSQSNAAIAVFDFGTEKVSSESTFTATLPSANKDNALIRLEVEV